MQDNNESFFKHTSLNASGTQNTPLKEILAVCEVQPKWRGVIAKLTEGTPVDEAPTFLQQLGIERVLAKKVETSES